MLAFSGRYSDEFNFDSAFVNSDNMNTLSFLEEIARNVRFSLRALRRSPGFAATAILTLAIGIGANTAVFSVVNGVLLKPLPYPEAGRLISVQRTAPGAPGLMSASVDLRPSASMFFAYAERTWT